MGQRYYDPAVGRFLNRDTTGYDGGIGLYDYCNNQPNDFADPSGEQAVMVPVIVVTVVVIGVAIYVMVNGVAHYAGQGGLDSGGFDLAAGDGKKLRGKVCKLKPEWPKDKVRSVVRGITHEDKPTTGAGPANNIRIDSNGNIWGPKPGNEYLGNLNDWD